jgi:diguanylate cyclase (GGDEF)-like protein
MARSVSGGVFGLQSGDGEARGADRLVDEAARRSIGRLARRVAAWLPGFKVDSIWPEVVAIGCFLILPWIGITVALHHEYRHARDSAVQSTANLAQALEESTRRTIGQIDTILLSARAFRAAEGERFDFHDWLLTQTLPDRMTAQIAMADAEGRVTESTMPLAPGVSVADRLHFLTQRDPARDELYISAPVVGRISGLMTVQFSRKLLDRDGGFAGAIVLSFGSIEMARFYDSLRLGHGFVSIVTSGGITLARGPWIPGLVGSRITDTALANGVLERTAGSLALPANAVRGDQIASFRRLPDYPLIVMVGFDADTVFEPYRSLRMNALLNGAAISLAVSLVGFLWVGQKRRSLMSRRALTVTLDTISQGILMVDRQGEVSVINPRMLDLLGGPTETADHAMRFIASRANGLMSSQTGCVHVEPAVLSKGLGAFRYSSRFETTLDGGTIVEVRTHALSGGGFVQTYTDVTEQRQAHAQVVHLALHDSLTGLANRTALMQRIAAIVDRDASGDALSALIMIDLDGFKGVNDTLGHDAGDKLLIEVGRRLRALVRGTDMVARLGGDEFVVLVQGLHQPEEAAPLAERVLRRLAEPAEIQGRQVRIGASLGIAFHPHDGPDVDTWLKHADMALYSAKNSGRGTYRCFDQQLFQVATEHHLLESELRQALDDDELEVHFQPKFGCGSLEIVGFEALARWRHPVRGYVSPAVFIRIAEDCGLINRLGRWVLERACRCVAGWQPRYPVAVNVSVMQLRDGGLKDHIAAVLAQTGLIPKQLEIEVTESVMADDDQTVLENLRAIKTMGIAISLDDFGTGYSSLGYLRRFSFDKIKIDRSFVQGQADDPGVRIIFEAMLGLCHNLGLATIGEGVETQEQLHMLRDCGCTEVQGYLLGRPMPNDKVQDFIRGRLRLAGDYEAEKGAVPLVDVKASC